MRTINLDLEQSEAVVAWNDEGLVGYAVHKEHMWTCVTEPDEARHVFRHGDAALRWLHEKGKADFFEALADSNDLGQLIDSRHAGASPDQDEDRTPEVTHRLNAIAACD